MGRNIRFLKSELEPFRAQFKQEVVELARPVKHDGGLYKREGSKIWWMRYRDKDGIRQRESTLTEDWDEAQKRLRERLQARDNNTLPALRRGQDLTFGEWADFYLENFSRPPFRAQKTHEVNQRALKHLRKMFENTKLAELTADDIEMYLRKRLKQRALVKTKAGFVEKQVLKATTVHQEFRVLRRMLNVAVRKKFLFANPCAGVEFPARVDGLFRPHYVTWSEQQKIEFAAPEYLRNVIRIVTETGLAHLQRADADEEGSARSGEPDGVDSGLEDAQRSRRGSVDGHRG